MAITYVLTGTNANDGTGDDLRTAFQKINSSLQYLDGQTSAAAGGVAANIPLGTGQGFGLYYSKGVLTNSSGQTVQNNANALNFRSLKQGAGIAITVDTDYNLVLSSTVAAPNTITTITGNSGSYTAPAANSTFQIVGDLIQSYSPPGTNPTPYTRAIISGNKILISHDSRLVLDPAPTLGANLSLGGFNITGTGNLNFTGNINTNSGTITSGSHTASSISTASGSITTLTAGTLTVTGSTILAAASSTQFTGPLSGNTTGVHKGDIINQNSHTVFNSTTNTFAGTSGDTLTFNGIHTGSHSGNLGGNLSTTGTDSTNYSITGTGYINLSSTGANLTITSSSAYTVSQFITSGVNSQRDTLALKLVQQKNNLISDGPGLGFTSIDTSNTLGTVDHGLISMMTDLTGNQGSAFYIRLRSAPNGYSGSLSAGTGITPGYANTFRSDGLFNTQFSGLKFALSNVSQYNTTIDIDQTAYLNGNNLSGARDIILTNTTAGYVNFYGQYKMPKTIGTTGQVLTVPVAGNILSWSSGGGSGSGGTLTITSTTGSPNYYFVTSSTAALSLNVPIVFTGTLGGVTSGQTYYVSTIASSTQFTVSTVNGGSVFQNTSATGSMIASYSNAVYLSSLLDGPGPYQSSNANSVVVINGTYNGFTYTKTLSGLTLNSSTLNGNASTATALQNARTINGVSFDGTANITLNTDNVQESVTPTNLYFTAARSRSSIGVTANQALTYNSGTGIFSLNASVTSTALYLVQRDNSQKINVVGVNTDQLGVNVASNITVNSDLTGAFNINTTGNVTANNFVYNGSGPYTLTSPNSIKLNPTTYIDVNSKNIQNLATPSNANDAANKTYVDTAVGTVATASMTVIPINADQGGSFNLAKNSTFTITGGANIQTTTGTNSVTVALKGSLSNVNFASSFSVLSGNITVSNGYVKGGNLQLGGSDNNSIVQTSTGSDLKLTPGIASGGGSAGAVVINGYLEVDTSLNIISNEQVTIAANGTAVTVNVDANVSFITTQDWLNDQQAGLANITLPPSNRNGQMKTIKMKSRGQYGSNALNVNPRYALVSGNIDGTSKTISLSQSSPNGSLTFISLNGYWWLIGQIA
jgi:fibronectin-binding autotransporter adhesin